MAGIKSFIQKMESCNQYSTEPVPQNLRKSWVGQMFVWVGWVFSVTGFMGGALIGSQQKLGSAILAIVLGMAVLAIIGVLQSSTGAKTGLSTYVLSRYAFGIVGSKIISFIFALTIIGWLAVGISVAADAASYILPFDPQAISFVFAIIMSITALFDYKGIEWLSRMVVPAIVVFLVFGLYKATAGGLASLFALDPTDPKPFTMCVATVINSWITGAIVAADIGRYAKTEKDAGISTTLAFVVGCTFFYIVGAIFSLAVGTWDIVEIMVGLQMGMIGLFLLIAIQWTTIQNNLYSGSLGMANTFDKTSKLKITLALAAAGVVLSTFKLYNYFFEFILISGTLIVPIAGVLITDAHLFSGKYERDHKEIKLKIHFPAVVAWIVGVAVGHFIQVGSSAVNSIIASALVYFVVVKMTRSSVFGNDEVREISKAS